MSFQIDLLYHKIERFNFLGEVLTGHGWWVLLYSGTRKREWESKLDRKVGLTQVGPNAKNWYNSSIYRLIDSGLHGPLIKFLRLLFFFFFATKYLTGAIK